MAPAASGHVALGGRDGGGGGRRGGGGGSLLTPQQISEDMESRRKLETDLSGERLRRLSGTWKVMSTKKLRRKVRNSSR